jgi:hypothetical protein
MKHKQTGNRKLAKGLRDNWCILQRRLAGVPHEELEPLKVDGEIVMRRVADYFGLRLDDIDQIITLNDEIETWEPDHVQKRRDNVVEFIKTLWEETNPVPL